MRKKIIRRFCLLFCVCFLLLPLAGCAGDVASFTDAGELNDGGVTIAIWSDSPMENALHNAFPDATPIILDSISMFAANLRGNKIDAFLTSKVFFDTLPNHTDMKILDGEFGAGEYAFFFAQNEKGRHLRDQMNEFVVRANESGLREELEHIWLEETSVGRPIGTGCDDPNAPELIYASENETPPFGYMDGDKAVGFDADYAECFCKEYGYRLKVVGLPFSMIASGDVTGEYDFAGGALLVDEELKAARVTSDPHYLSPIVPVVLDGEATESVGFDLKDGLYRSVIENDRWKDYLSGLWSTLVITVLSAVAGTLLGFAVYYVGINANALYHRTVDVIFTVLDITPEVVLLMIFYHIVFHGARISGLLVSTVVFTLLMAGSTYSLLTSSVAAVGIGQTEAAIALGCTPTQAFFRVVMPQAMRHFIPIYKGNLVGLVKLTSVVGYIAVQDLTMVSDIIRTLTFDAFVPLFFAAVIYILLALLLIGAINLLFLKTDPKKRSRGKIIPSAQNGKEAAK